MGVPLRPWDCASRCATVGGSACPNNIMGVIRMYAVCDTADVYNIQQ